MRKARPGNPEDRWHRASEIHDAKRQQFQVWAAAVRACVEETQALARQSMEKGQALEHLLQSPDPDPDAIGTMILDLRARRLEIEGIIAALPTLDDIGQARRAALIAPFVDRDCPADGGLSGSTRRGDSLDSRLVRSPAPLPRLYYAARSSLTGGITRVAGGSAGDDARREPRLRQVLRSDLLPGLRTFSRR